MLEKAATPLATEHLLIFTDAAKTRQIWLWTSRLPGKPVSHRELMWEKGKANELLLQKLSSIAFTLDEEDALDITGVVLRLRDSLDRDKVTKKFYDQFKIQKDAFRKFIKGIADGGLWDWYTSLMLNRLMFCYFLQRKGFLDGDTDYLSNRLGRVRDEIGKGQFHSFYKTFLRRLFHEGLGQTEGRARLRPSSRSSSGRFLISMAASSKSTKSNATIPVSTSRIKLSRRFSPFSTGSTGISTTAPSPAATRSIPKSSATSSRSTPTRRRWAPTTRRRTSPTTSPRTASSRSCSMPPATSSATPLGISCAKTPIATSIPPSVTASPATIRRIRNSTRLCRCRITSRRESTPRQPDLRKRRARWNESATPELGLPTEIWRETVARRQRCEELQRKLRAGEVRAVNDLITLNLNIRQFAQDVVENAAPDLLLALFKAIRKVSVLDPTCGSGAFLFAALNILEPLYRACLDRMRALLGDWEARGDKSHPNYRKEFAAVLDQAARHPNENYFIFKSIIVHNLYGVDIMEEAVEICKLRLFLKLAAQLEPGQEIEPLPDIDFNIRAGNTLVGYASRDEVRRCMTQFGDGQMRLGVEDELQSYSRFQEAAENVNSAFQLFQQMQDEYGMNAAEFREQKRVLSERLQTLRDQLDRFIAADYDKRNRSDAAFEKWRAAHRPFHWFVEFFGILNSGGFDAVIGNPPYFELKELKDYRLQSYQCLDAGNIYAVVLERCAALGSKAGRQGFIVPVSSVSTDRYSPLQKLLARRSDHFSSFDDRPSRLFDGLEHIRLTIHLLSGHQPSLYSSRYNKWAAVSRETLFQTLVLESSQPALIDGTFPKISSPLEHGIIGKLKRQSSIGRQISKTGRQRIFYSRKVRLLSASFGFRTTRSRWEWKSTSAVGVQGATFRQSRTCFGCAVLLQLIALLLGDNRFLGLSALK